MNDATKYIRAVKRSFTNFHKGEKHFYADLCSNVTDYAANHPTCTYEDLENHFGNPKDIVIDYYNTMEQDVYSMHVMKIRYFRYITMAAISVLSIVLGISLYLIISEKQKYDTSEIAYKEITITVDEQNDTDIKGDDSK